MGKGWVTILIVSSILALIAYVRALTGTWWGPAAAETPQEASKAPETGIARLCIVLLAALLVIAGVLPSTLEFVTRGIR
jgi:formate hydrogenlyase subunit 3/multisubunit Na+/H+ antiporter MnhD subunit